MNKVKIVVYWLLFIGMLIMNYLSALNVGNVANKNQAMIQPAGWAFSIWSIIYLLLFIWLIRMSIMAFRHQDEQWSIGWWPGLNFVLNGLWIYVFSEQSKLLSNFVIIGLLLTLIIIYRKVQRRPFDKLVFSIYFSWVTVASIVNIFTWVKSLEVDTVLGLNELIWTLIMLTVGTMLAIYITLKYHDWVYPLVFVYAYMAIWAEHGRAFNSLGIVLLLSMMLQIISSLYTVLKNRVGL